ncbi:hypothetical protein EJG51_016535 [Undibacterium piscinae]|uniref:Uncharacterized protein n=1 Tax=Undibacterium piscinae TaxID=2495591 RepID=A0A6M4A7K2_9BURK|nr:hypothetical protein EJG51_016535 [Undibacterium piscinae]
MGLLLKALRAAVFLAFCGLTFKFTVTAVIAFAALAVGAEVLAFSPFAPSLISGACADET